MNDNQKTAKIDMSFGYRFGVALGWVLERVWEAKNLNFGSFFEQKSKAKKHDVLEGPKKPSRRGKKQSPECSSDFDPTARDLLPRSWASGGGVGEEASSFPTTSLIPKQTQVALGEYIIISEVRYINHDRAQLVCLLLPGLP